MRDLAWLVGLLLAAMITASQFQVAEWFMIILGWLALLSVFLYLVLYVYFAFSKPDYLRSEKYTIHKMAIEHGLFGDDRVGLRRASLEDVLELPSGGQSKEKEDTK